MPLKPIVKWSGGKSDELSKFQEHIPTDYDTYLEPFMGGGARGAGRACGNVPRARVTATHASRTDTSGVHRVAAAPRCGGIPSCSLQW